VIPETGREKSQPERPIIPVPDIVMKNGEDKKEDDDDLGSHDR
jgi:hypothetical protein